MNHSKKTLCHLLEELSWFQQLFEELPKSRFAEAWKWEASRHFLRNGSDGNGTKKITQDDTKKPAKQKCDLLDAFRFAHFFTSGKASGYLLERMVAGKEAE